MNQSSLVQSCFTMQMFFYHTFQNMLIINCSTRFQGAIHTYQNFFKLSSRKSPCTCTAPCPWLPLLSQLPSPSFVISSPLEEGASSPPGGGGAQCEEPGRAGSPPPAPQPTARLEPPPAGAVSTRMKCSWGGPRRHSLRHEKGWNRPPQSAHGPSPLTGYHTPGPCCPAG